MSSYQNYEFEKLLDIFKCLLPYYLCRNFLTCIFVYFKNYSLSSVDGILSSIGFSLEVVTI